MSMLDTLRSQGITLALNGDNLLVEAKSKPSEDILAALKEHKAHLIEELKRQEIASALKRLELGECEVVRLHTRFGDMLLSRYGEIPESITVDCPTFSLAELEQLAATNAGAERCRAVYLVKQQRPGAKVVDDRCSANRRRHMSGLRSKKRGG